MTTAELIKAYESFNEKEKEKVDTLFKEILNKWIIKWDVENKHYDYYDCFDITVNVNVNYGIWKTYDSYMLTATTTLNRLDSTEKKIECSTLKQATEMAQKHLDLQLKKYLK